MTGGFSRQRLLAGGVLTVVGLLELDGWDVAEGAVEAVLVEPVDPVQGRELEVVDTASGAFGTDALELGETDEGLRLRVVVGVPDGPDRTTVPASD